MDRPLCVNTACCCPPLVSPGTVLSGTSPVFTCIHHIVEADYSCDRWLLQIKDRRRIERIKLSEIYKNSSEKSIVLSVYLFVCPSPRLHKMIHGLLFMSSSCLRAHTHVQASPWIIFMFCSRCQQGLYANRDICNADRHKDVFSSSLNLNTTTCVETGVSPQILMSLHPVDDLTWIKSTGVLVRGRIRGSIDPTVYMLCKQRSACLCAQSWSKY